MILGGGIINLIKACGETSAAAAKMLMFSDVTVLSDPNCQAKIDFETALVEMLASLDLVIENLNINRKFLDTRRHGQFTFYKMMFEREQEKK